MSEKFGRFVNRLRRSRDLTQAELAKELGVTKSQVCHIEVGRRGIGQEAFENFLRVTNPTLKELDELSRICYEEGVGVELPRQLWLVTPVKYEMQYQRSFSAVDVVSYLPIEVTAINDRNPFLMGLVTVLGENATKTRKYRYWTSRESRSRFKAYFHFLQGNGISGKTIQDSFEFILVPDDLLLIDFAVYSIPQDVDREYRSVGRILLRDGYDVGQYKVTKMGEHDLLRSSRYLNTKYDELQIYGQMQGYQLNAMETLL